MPVLLSHGCNFLVQTFRLTKYRSLPAGNAKRLHALSQSSKSLTDYARFSRGRVGELRDHFFRFTYTCTLHPSFLSYHKYLHILLRKKKKINFWLKRESGLSWWEFGSYEASLPSYSNIQYVEHESRTKCKNLNKFTELFRNALG